MTFRRLLVPALAGILLLAALGAPASAVRAKAKTHKVVAEGTWPFLFRWNPAAVEIAVGDKVRWTNTTTSDHHITPYEGPWPKDTHLHLPEGGKASFTFKKPGVYKYYCDLQYHGQLLPGGECFGQCGEITVG